MAELPGESEGAEIIELFPAPKPVEYEVAEVANLSPEELKVLIMRGLVSRPDDGAEIPAHDAGKSRRVEGRSIVTSLRAIEEAAIAALKEGRDRV